MWARPRSTGVGMRRPVSINLSGSVLGQRLAIAISCRQVIVGSTVTITA
jgi:hypothetical protein